MAAGCEAGRKAATKAGGCKVAGCKAAVCKQGCRQARLQAVSEAAGCEAAGCKAVWEVGDARGGCETQILAHGRPTKSSLELWGPAYFIWNFLGNLWAPAHFIWNFCWNFSVRRTVFGTCFGTCFGTFIGFYRVWYTSRGATSTRRTRPGARPAHSRRTARTQPEHNLRFNARRRASGAIPLQTPAIRRANLATITTEALSRRRSEHTPPPGAAKTFPALVFRCFCKPKLP